MDEQNRGGKHYLGQLGAIGGNRKAKLSASDLSANGDPLNTPAAAGNPKLQQLLARHQAITARGPLALLLVDTPLPPGVLAIVKLGMPAPLTRFFAMSKSSLSDESIDRAEGLAFAYEMQHPDDVGPVTFTMYTDGRVERNSATLGVETGTFNIVGNRGPDVQTPDILQNAQHAKVYDVPGFGPARVFRFTR